MPDHTTMRAELWQRLTELPKPIDMPAIRQCATEMHMPPRESTEFLAWADKNAAYLLSKLNAVSDHA